MTLKSLNAKLEQSSPQLSVGTLTADMMCQKTAIQTLEKANVPLLHLDVMDGKVWPKITAGSPFLTGLKTSLLKDVHLLIEEPEKHIADFAKAGADLISFSVEYTQDIANVLHLIGEASNANDPNRKILRGVSLNPDTSVNQIKLFLNQIDFVVLLAVGPETGKQSFLSIIPDKIKQLRHWKESLLIFIDGSVKKDNIGKIAKMKPDFIVTGSAIFDGNNEVGNLQSMQTAIQQTKAN